MIEREVELRIAVSVAVNVYKGLSTVDMRESSKSKRSLEKSPN